MSSQPEVFEDSSYEAICEQIGAEGRKKYGPGGYTRLVFSNGVFDLLHMGHLKLLNECRSIAGPRGAVVIGVNTDASVSRLKGPTRPITDEATRCSIIVFMKAVDHVVTFEEDTPLKLVEALKPDVIVKGSDYKGKLVVGSHLAPVVYVNLESGKSTTSIIERIQNVK